MGPTSATRSPTTSRPARSSNSRPQWSPDHDAHFCIQARIDRYTRVPGAAADEPDVDNNLAQTNYFKVESKPSSPATREVSYVEVHNPYPYEASALVDVAQDTDGYRTFVDHHWLHLQPGQTRLVRMEVESKATSIWDAVERHHPDGSSLAAHLAPGHRLRGAHRIRGHGGGRHRRATDDADRRARARPADRSKSPRPRGHRHRTTAPC